MSEIMNKYTLTLTRQTTQDNPFSVTSYDVIVADNLVELCSKFSQLVAMTHDHLMREANAAHDADDIPF